MPLTLTTPLAVQGLAGPLGAQVNAVAASASIFFDSESGGGAAIITLLDVNGAPVGQSIRHQLTGPAMVAFANTGKTSGVKAAIWAAIQVDFPVQAAGTFT